MIPADPASKTIVIKTTFTPLEGGWARLESFSGKGYGQTTTWCRPPPAPALLAASLFLVVTSYHPSREWLEERAYDPDKAGCVEVRNAGASWRWTREQPWMVRHELVHSWFETLDRRWGREE